MKIKPCSWFQDTLHLPRKTCLGLLVASLSLAAQPVPGAGQQLHGHLPEAVARLTPTGRMPLTNELRLAICLPLRNQDALTNLLEQIYDPASPNYRHYLTPGEFTDKFGPTESDYQAVIGFAKAHGLAVAQQHPNRTLLDVRGTVADIEKTFHVTLRVYRHPKEARSFYAPDAEPSLDLAVPVLHVGGLDNYELPHPVFKMRPADRGRTFLATTGSGPGGNFMGRDFRNAYAPNVTLTGTGQTVALFEMDGYYASDITYYENMNGLPNVTLTNVLLGGFAGTPVDSDAEVEVCLDIEMAISMAPGLSRVMVYEAPLTSVGAYDILNQMATDNQAKQISSSWVIDRIVTTPVPNQIYLQYAAQGQSFFQASGDEDAYVPGTFQTADNPYITTVGGTTLTTTSSGGSYVSETVWQWGGGTGTGGGISTSFAIPTYQQGINMTTNLGSTTMRNVPDVALTADNVYVRAGGEDDLGVGGTSCAAPLWAGFMALVNQQAVAAGKPAVGFINPAVYALAQTPNYANCFHDIVNGNNTNSASANHFFAVPGFDLCTGWGTPAGQNLITALVNPDALSITPNPGFASIGGVGGPFTITSQSLTLTNAGTNTLIWSLANTSLWLNVAPGGGTLTPGGPSTTVTASLNLAASNLLVGAYAATVWFTNLNDNVGQSGQFTLSVISPPTITHQPVAQVVPDGMTATFSAGISGGLPLRYQWQANGNNLTDGTRISGSASNILVIQNISPADDANYQLIVTNAAGVTVSSNATLTAVSGNVDHFSWNTIPAVVAVGTPFPAGITALDTANVVATNFNSSVAISGGGAALYQFNFESGLQGFSFDNSMGSGNGMWHLSTGRAADVGHSPTQSLYYGQGERVTGGGNYDNGVANGGVVISPAMSLPAGQTAITLSFNYLMNVKSLTNYDVAYVEISTNNGVSYEAVAAKNTFGGLTNITYGLWISSTVNISAFGGQTVKLRFRFDTIDTIYNDTEGWYVDDIVIRSTSPVVPVTPANAGPFTNGIWSGNAAVLQMATNVILTANDGAVHSGSSNPFIVTYSNQPPIIVLQPTNQTLPAGYNAAIVMAAVGSPPLSYLWSSNGIPNPAATNSAYTLNNVQLADSGSQFSCLVSNPFGNTNSQVATLTVVALPPTITQQPVNQTVPLGGTASFSVTAAGSLPLSYSWMRNGAPIAGATNASYGANNVQLGDSGSQFSCLVSNAFGSLLSSTSVLTVVTLPTDWFTELFAASITNLAFNTFTFTPDGSANSYAVCRQPAASFPTDPTGGTRLAYYDDNYVQITIAGGNTVAIYNNRTNVLFIGSNGYLTMKAGDMSDSPSYAIHFVLPRVSALYGDLYPAAGGTVTWKQLSDRIAVSYQGVPIEGNNYQTNTFQVEMFFDGRIRITYLGLKAPNGLIGLSAGAGQPTNFVASDFTSYAGCSPQPPVISVQPGSQTIPIGGNVTFNVTAVGTAPMGYFWQRNGAFIAGATNFNYTANNVQLADSGSQFSCIVSNAFGTTNSQAATLTVVALPPTIAQQPASQTVSIGGTASFTVMAAGSLPLNYLWMRNGTAIAGATNSTYTTNNVQLADAGSQFSCVVSNAYGTTNSLPASLTVVSYTLGTILVFYPNGPVSVFASALTNLNLPFQLFDWYHYTNFSAAVAAADPASSLVIVDSDSGIFDCTNLSAYVNSGGRAVMDYWYLGSFPDLAAAFQAVTVSYFVAPLPVYDWGGSTLFNGVATPLGFTDIDTLDGDLLQPVGNARAVAGFVSSPAANVAAIIIGNSQRSIVNGFVFSEIRPFTNAVQLAANEIQLVAGASFAGSAPSITLQPSNVTVPVGGNASFAVGAGGTPRLGYFWQRNGVFIAGATNSSYTTNNVQLADSGSQFSCIISNAYGTTNSQAATLTVVAYPPIITQQPANQTVLIRGTATFSVTVIGTAPLNYVWMRNGMPIAGANNSSYTTNNVQLADSGSQFSCIVSNAYGTTNSLAATLTVLPLPPAITQQPVNQTVFVGGTASFRVTATGSPPPDYLWMRNGTAIAWATNASYTANNVQLSDSGSQFSCVVSNAFGTVISSNAALVVLAKGNGISYLRSTLGQPWGVSDNEKILTMVFGTNNWQDLRYETASPAALLSTSNRFIFMEGSDNNALALGAFLTNNLPAISNWVAAGGSLFVNAAPNVGGNLYLGFGVTLTYPDTSSTGGVANAASAIFYGPYLPAIATYTGTSFSQASVSGSTLTALITNSGTAHLALAEEPYALGHLIFGGMTLPSFHTPQPQASNLLANILAYGAGVSTASNPGITLQPASLAVPSGSNATFTVGAAGAWPLSFFWKRDSALIAGATNASYTTNNVQLADSGSQFSCVVSNAYGATNSQMATLTVMALPPTIAQQPVNQTVSIGGTASFSVTATGSLPLSYFWMRNGTAIAGATNSSYTTNNVPLAGSGSQFSCVVSNAYGTTNSQAATLTVVAYPPAITQQPADQTVLIGGTATFSVTATGTAPLNYFWMRNGTPIAGATNSSYTTNNVQLSDSGSQFSCRVTNFFGSVLSSNGVLTVVTNNPSSVLVIWDINTGGTLALSNALAKAGLSVTLSATFGPGYTGANPSPTGFGAVIHLNGKTFYSDMPTAGQLALVNYVQNGGGYIESEWDAYGYGQGMLANLRDVILFDRAGSGSGSMTLTNVPGQAGHPVLANVPSSITFQAAYNAGPAHVFSTNPVTVLMREGTDDAVAVRQFGAGRIVGFSHAGNAYNNTLSDTNVQLLYVNAVRWAANQSSITSPPSITAQPSSVTVPVGGSASFAVGASGTAPLNYFWERNGAFIAGATNSTYTTNNVQLADSGSQFSCVVSNSYGTTNSATASLTVSVDHFVWGAINSPQLVNSPFAATIIAQDVNNQIVTNFTGALALSGAAEGALTSNTILGSPVYSSSGSGYWTLGYAITPATNLTVTHVRHYFGTKVSIWTDGGTLLATQTVASVPGTWGETALATPLTLTAGVRYRVAAYSGGTNYYWRTDLTNNFPNGTIDQSYEALGDVFPASSDTVKWWFVSLRYTLGSPRPIAMTPTNTGSFAGGAWTGNVTVLQTATNVVLLANDGLGHSSSSNPFQVVSNSVITQVTMLPGGCLQITLAGSPGEVYQVLGSTDLLDWKVIATVTNVTGTVQFTNPEATNCDRCFYRLVMP